MNKILPVILFILPLRMLADTLTPDRAVELALANNHNIRLAEVLLEIRETENSYGAAGFLPSVILDASRSNSVSDISQQFYNGEDRTTNNARSGNLEAGVNANWTFFDGLAMFAVKKRLEALEEAGEYALRAAIETSLAELLTTYYQLAAEVQIAEVLRQNLELSAQRRAIALARYQLGSSSELLYMQASADFVSDSMLLLNNKLNAKILKGELNRLMGRAPDTEFTVSTVMPVSQKLQLEELLTALESDNPQLLQARAEARAAEERIAEERAARLPRLSLFGGYNYARSSSEAGLLQSNRSLGPSYGISATYDLFRGGEVNRRTRIAGMEARAAGIAVDQVRIDATTQLYNTYQAYLVAFEQVQAEEVNLATVRRNAEVALEAYRLGSISDLQLREIQRQLLEAENRLYLAQFGIIRNEILLRSVTGSLANR